ncbi:transglutaminase TgpA family protein [Thermocatellispora tengchongensis]|nr:DUF3488 and transglutaminase-like domain-containing protein [Thermocatellispora tengchongensis]
MRLSFFSGLATAAVAVTLYPLFAGSSWLWSSLGAILLIIATGLLATRYRLPGWLTPLAQLTVLWVYLTASFAADDAWARIVPTRDAFFTLAELTARGFDDIQRFAAPVPDNPGITLITAAGVGLIAVMVDALAVRARRAALAGLPLLALFIVPAEIVAEPLAWPAFILAAAGYTGLLAADGRERVGRWGRAVLVRRTRGTARPAADAGGLRLSGKRVGVTAIALAIVLPALIPTLEPNPLFGFGVGGPGNGRNGNTISIPNPIVSLKGQLTLPDNATVLTYRSSDNLPHYLRMWSLDLFTGEQWTMTPPTGRPQDRVENGPLPPPPGFRAGVPTKRAQMNIQISEDIDDLQFLPLPYPATEVGAEGDWRADRSTLMVFSTRDYAEGLQYTVTSDQPAPTRDLLQAAGPPGPEVVERYLELPPDLPPRIRQLAREVTAEEVTPYDKAVRLQEWFTGDGNFSYNLQTQGHGNSALIDFLINSRVGYCEQFAAAMAVMARVLDIPARVAIGYTGGTNVGGTWQVGTHDSHAWPELYFEGVGWLAFEPTPAGALGQGTARPPDYSVPPPDDPATGDATSDPSESASPDETTSTADPTAPRNPRLEDREGTLAPVVTEEDPPVAPRIGAGVALLVLLLLVPALVRTLARSRRLRTLNRPLPDPGPPAVRLGPGAPADGTAGITGAPAERADPADRTGHPMAGITGARTGQGDARARHYAAGVAAAWAELDDLLYDYGVTRDPSETPRTLAQRVSQQHGFDPKATESLRHITTVAERMLFARTPGDPGLLSVDLRRVRRALAATAPRGRRIRATLMPPSTLRRLRALGTRLLDGWDRLESLRLRRPRRTTP